MTRTAIVTGGTRGIGRAISIALKDAGYRVAANYGRNDAAAESFAAETGIPVYKWDVGDEAACEAGVAKVVADSGRIEVLVNNAGISPDKFMHKMPTEFWLRTINTNLNGCFYMCRQVIGPMRENKYGRIINISSVNAFRAAMGETHYDASKAGMIGFTKALALESARLNITVNAVAPGLIDTDMIAPGSPEWREEMISQIPVGRIGRTEEIARGVVFLADEASSFITGATLDINGGQYLR